MNVEVQDTSVEADREAVPGRNRAVTGGRTATPGGRSTGSMTVVESEFVITFSAIVGAVNVKGEVEDLDRALSVA